MQWKDDGTRIFRVTYEREARTRMKEKQVQTCVWTWGSWGVLEYDGNLSNYNNVQ
jgi:hypothetical protein